MDGRLLRKVAFVVVHRCTGSQFQVRVHAHPALLLRPLSKFGLPEFVYTVPYPIQEYVLCTASGTERRAHAHFRGRPLLVPRPCRVNDPAPNQGTTEQTHPGWMVNGGWWMLDGERTLSYE